MGCLVRYCTLGAECLLVHTLVTGSHPNKMPKGRTVGKPNLQPILGLGSTPRPQIDTARLISSKGAFLPGSEHKLARGLRTCCYMPYSLSRNVPWLTVCPTGSLFAPTLNLRVTSLRYYISYISLSVASNIALSEKLSQDVDPVRTHCSARSNCASAIAKV